MKQPKGHKLDLNLNGQKKGKYTKYFLGLEKSNIFDITTNGKTSSSNSEILQEMCNFYENLYTSKSTNDEKIANYIEKVACPTLHSKDKEV